MAGLRTTWQASTATRIQVLITELHSKQRQRTKFLFVKAKYRDADKSSARSGRKQATATEDFEFHIFYLYQLEEYWYSNKTSIKRNILTIKQNTLLSRSG
jgi:hypothetical protein